MRNSMTVLRIMTLAALCSLFFAAFLTITALAQEPGNDLFTRLDANKDGKVVLDELPEDQKRNFRKIDANNDGAISRDELNAYSRGGGERIQPTHRDLVFGEADGQKLMLNLYLPKNVEQAPLVVYIHGGSWRAGSYKSCETDFLVQEGFAVASISYRFTNVAIFPAQIHDCKAAIRWLRANAQDYGYDATKIGVAGSSAGGHLAVLLGTSGGVADLEGDIGGNTDQSSRVAAVVDYYGPTDFVLRGKTHHARANAVGSSTYGLLGGPANENPEKARRASGVTYVTPDDPPMLILHGDKDQTVYMDQSESLRDAYVKATLPVELIVIPGAAHGGKEFYTGENRRRVTEFFNKHLRSAKK